MRSTNVNQASHTFVWRYKLEADFCFYSFQKAFLLPYNYRCTIISEK